MENLLARFPKFYNFFISLASYVSIKSKKDNIKEHDKEKNKKNILINNYFKYLPKKMFN